MALRPWEPMEIVMLKHFAAATIGLALGLAFLMGAIGPAAAGKGSHYWTGKYPSGCHPNGRPKGSRNKFSEAFLADLPHHMGGAR